MKSNFTNSKTTTITAILAITVLLGASIPVWWGKFCLHRLNSILNILAISAGEKYRDNLQQLNNKRVIMRVIVLAAVL